jgi:hypothetical protein
VIPDCKNLPLNFFVKMFLRLWSKSIKQVSPSRNQEHKMKLIQDAYLIYSNTIQSFACTMLSDKGVEWVLIQLGRSHETQQVLENARRMAGGSGLYPDASMNRYALERHLGLWA